MDVVSIIGKNYFGHWSSTRTACRAIIQDEGKLLLSYETKTDQWMIPGGGLEPDEDEASCCVRETEEETGILVQAEGPFLEIDEYYEDEKFISKYFICRPIGQGVKALTKREQQVGMEPRWLPFDQIKAIFAAHATYAATDEMRRGLYLREYTALCAFEKCM